MFVVRACKATGGPRAQRRGLPFAALRVPSVPQLWVAPRNSLRSLRSLRSNRRGESDDEARLYARRPKACGARRRLCAAPAAHQSPCRSWLLALGVAKKDTRMGPEESVATVRFLVPQHERGRHAVLGPSANEPLK